MDVSLNYLLVSLKFEMSFYFAHLQGDLFD